MSEDHDNKPLTSPDGSLRIEFKVTGGDREPEFLNPRVVDALSGEVLVDLWDTGWSATWTVAGPEGSTLEVRDYYSGWAGELTFVGAGKLSLTLTDPVSGRTEVADIDGNDKTFALARRPEKREPLASFWPWFDQLVDPPPPPAPPVPRWKDFLMLMGSLGFVALIIWTLFYSREPTLFTKLVGWVGIVLFGLGAVIGLVGMLGKR